MPEPATITVTLPLPPKQLHPNAGTRHNPNWIARLVKDYRRDAKYCALSVGMPDTPWARARCTPTFYFRTKSNRGRDGDNLTAWLKHGFDGVVDAGLIRDDKFLICNPPIQELDSRNPRVELRFERIGDRP